MLARFLVLALSGGVPTSVVSSTIQAASLLAPGQAASEMISVKLAALVVGVLKTMVMTKFKTVTAIVLLVALAGVGAGSLLFRTQAGEPSKGIEKTKRHAVQKDEKPMSAQERLQEEVERERKRLVGFWRLVSVEGGGHQRGS
ncbi:MAG TPA: hypothetical protein VMG10_27170 [Gemmataceae bacterium]|nr:hypothetical protein [Gemmataceae bacterium]